VDHPPGHAGPVEIDRHDVDPNVVADPGVEQAVGLCELPQLIQLAPRDRLLRQSVVAAATSFHLYHNQAFPIQHDEVDLAVAQAHVPFHQAHPRTAKPLLSRRFTRPAESGPAPLVHIESLILLSAFVLAKEGAGILHQDLASKNRARDRNRGE
jgi:hypothetical protein